MDDQEEIIYTKLDEKRRHVCCRRQVFKKHDPFYNEA